MSSSFTLRLKLDMYDVDSDYAYNELNSYVKCFYIGSAMGMCDINLDLRYTL